MRTGLLILWGLVAASISGAATIEEDFSGNPQQDGWKIFGDTNLFHWDATNQNLEVTWDSSQTNSYFYYALGTILARDDNFHLSFDLMFQDYASGTTPGKPYRLRGGDWFSKSRLCHANEFLAWRRHQQNLRPG